MTLYIAGICSLFLCLVTLYSTAAVIFKRYKISRFLLVLAFGVPFADSRNGQITQFTLIFLWVLLRLFMTILGLTIVILGFSLKLPRCGVGVLLIPLQEKFPWFCNIKEAELQEAVNKIWYIWSTSVQKFIDKGILVCSIGDTHSFTQKGGLAFFSIYLTHFSCLLLGSLLCLMPFLFRVVLRRHPSIFQRSALCYLGGLFFLVCLCVCSDSFLQLFTILEGIILVITLGVCYDGAKFVKLKPSSTILWVSLVIRLLIGFCICVLLLQNFNTVSLIEISGLSELKGDGSYPRHLVASCFTLPAVDIICSLGVLYGLYNLYFWSMLQLPVLKLLHIVVHVLVLPLTSTFLVVQFSAIFHLTNSLWLFGLFWGISVILFVVIIPLAPFKKFQGAPTSECVLRVSQDVVWYFSVFSVGSVLVCMSYVGQLFLVCLIAISMWRQRRNLRMLIRLHEEGPAVRAQSIHVLPTTVFAIRFAFPLYFLAESLGFYLFS